MMNDGIVARKGTAVPAATHPGDAARFHARRTVVLPAINLHAMTTQSDSTDARRQTQPWRAARLTGATTSAKRKFTFRIDMARHAAFCRAAESRNVSRQQLLTEALDALLRRLRQVPDTVPAAEATRTSTRASTAVSAFIGHGVDHDPFR